MIVCEFWALYAQRIIICLRHRRPQMKIVIFKNHFSLKIRFTIKFLSREEWSVLNHFVFVLFHCLKQIYNNNNKSYIVKYGHFQNRIIIYSLEIKGIRYCFGVFFV